MREAIPRIEILGVPVACLDPSAAIEEFARLYEEEAPSQVDFVNAHSLNLAARDIQYRRILRGAGLVLNDGAGVQIAARLQGRRFPANLNGSDFTPLILRLAAARGWRIFFLGGRAGVAVKAAEKFRAQNPGLRVVGACDGYSLAEAPGQIRANGADVLVVGMGNPLQEKWLDENLASTGARLGIAVGGLLDFASGRVPRAPQWMTRWGIEWLYRLQHEPRRLWRRYVVGNPEFVFRVAFARLRQLTGERPCQ